MSNHQETIARVAKSVRRALSQLSPAPGVDCILHARFGQYLLASQGIQSKIVVGEAAWRTGPDIDDVIAHSPSLESVGPVTENALALHAWLDVGGHILDLSTYSLRLKARLMDAMDGGRTCVQWCPEYLQLDPAQAVPLETVARGQQPGLVCYRQLPQLQTFIERKISLLPLDAYETTILRLVYANPDVHIFGPAQAVERELDLQHEAVAQRACPYL